MGGNQIQRISLINPLTCNTVGACVCRLAAALFTIGVPIAIMMVLVGAFQFMLAAGNPEKASSARKTIMYAVIGFVVLLVSRGVILAVYQILGGQPGNLNAC